MKNKNVVTKNFVLRMNKKDAKKTWNKVLVKFYSIKIDSNMVNCGINSFGDNHNLS